MRFRQDENGQMLVLTALSIVALLGFLALAVDMGLLFRSKRQVQTAADAGAIAAALEYSYVGTTNMGSVAGTAVSSNGVTLSYTPTLNTGCPDTTHNCAMVLTTGINGYHNTAGYVQVTAVQANPTFFMGMFGDSNVRTAASAIAGIEPNPDCLITLDPSGNSSFWIKGNSNVDTNNCGIHVNSNSNSAVCVQGSATIEGPYLKINGKQSGTGQCNKSPGTPVLGGASTASDPFANLSMPDPKNDGYSCQASGTTPNVYSGSVLDGTVSAEMTTFNSLTGLVVWPKSSTSTDASNFVTCFSANVTLQNVSLPAGIYVFENGVNIGSGVTVTNGTLYNYNGTFSDQNGTLNIVAPADKSAVFNALAIVQPSYNLNGGCADNSLKAVPCLQVQFGSTGTKNPTDTNCSGLTDQLCGFIYAPTSTVYLQDEGGGVEAAGVISYDFYNNGSLDVMNNYNSANPSTTPLSTIALVE